MPFQLAVSTYSLYRWRQENSKTLDDTLDWLSHQDVPGVEISPLDREEKIDVKRAGELRKRCETLGLEIVSYCIGGEFLVPGEQQAKLAEHLKDEVDVSVALGVKTMRHDVTRGPKGDVQMTFEQVLEAIVPSVRAVAEYAQEKGIKTSVENHGFYLQTADRVEQLVKAVGERRLGVTLDMGNFLCLNQDPVDAVRRLAKYTVMAHAKDFFVRPKDRMPPSGWFATPTEIALRGAILGHGVIDIPAQLAALKHAGYRGWLSVEFEGMEEPTAGVKLGLEYLRGEMKKLT